MRLVDQLCAELSKLPGVERSVTRFGAGRNPAWSIAGREFAHLHADHLLDLRLPRAVQAGLRTDPNAHFRKSRSEWLEHEVHTVDDVARLADLARQACVAVLEKAKD